MTIQFWVNWFNLSHQFKPGLDEHPIWNSTNF